MPFHEPKQHSLLESAHLAEHTHVKTWFVYQENNDYWWGKFLKPGYKHVFSLSFNGFQWIKMDFCLGWTDVAILNYTWRDTIHDIVKDLDCQVQYAEAWRAPRYRVRSLFAPWTCVEAMKSQLGVRAWWIVTPYQLYRYVEKYHGK